MKKKLCVMYLAIVALVMMPTRGWAETGTSWDGKTAYTDWYTNNSSATSFSISTPAQLLGLANLVNGGNDFAGKTITLTEDIDLGNKYWWPIGMYESTPFCGTFDGNGKVIKNLNVVAEESNPYIPCGLFGYVKGTSTSPVSIRNLGIASGSVYVLCIWQ